MAEVIDSTTTNNSTENTNYASNGKANAGLTLGIIGTALSGLGMLGGLGVLTGNLTGNSKGSSSNGTVTLSDQEQYLERKQNADYVQITKDYYEGKIQANERLTNAFFDAYQRDIDNSFNLYKYSRDSKDELASKIEAVDKKVDVMAAIRPYQDALIDAKINYNSLQDNYNLEKKTARMIEGNLVLPNAPISGFLGGSNVSASAFPAPPPFIPNSYIGPFA